MTTTPKRRWFQFSLRTLLVFVTLCAVACSWLAVKMREAERQRKAVEAIEKLGGAILYDWECDAKGNALNNPQPSWPQWLRNILGDNFFWRVAIIDISGKDVTDAWLEHLEGLRQLKQLALFDTQVSENGL